MLLVRDESCGHPHSEDESDCLWFAIHAHYHGAKYFLREFLNWASEISPLPANPAEQVDGVALCRGTEIFVTVRLPAAGDWMRCYRNQSPKRATSA